QNFSDNWERFYYALPPTEKTESHVEYTKFLIQKSFFSDCFLLKNVKSHMDIGSIMRTNIHINRLLVAAIFDRRRYEHPEEITNWYKLVNAGVDPNQSLFFMKIFYEYRGFLKFNRAWGSHGALNYYES